MQTNDMLLYDDPAAIAAAARTLSLEAHRALNRAVGGRSGRPDAALDALKGRVDVLLEGVGEDRLVDLRQWLRALQRRLSTVAQSTANPGATPMSKLLVATRSFAAREEGATLSEYVLSSVLIALVCIVAGARIGTAVRGFYVAIPL